MASTRKPPAKPAPAGNGATAPAQAANEPLAFNVEVARGLVSSSLDASQGLLRFLDQLQQMNSQSLKEMSTILGQAIGEARRANDVQELLTLQANLVNTQMARAVQNCGSLLARWLDAETQFVEQAQEGAARFSRQVLGNGAGAAPQVAKAADATPLALLGDAQNAMAEMTGQWVEMVKNFSARAQLAQL